MKTATALLALLLAAQAGADCSDIQWHSDSGDSREIGDVQVQETRQQTGDPVQRRRAYLDCFRPAPFVQEPIEIELDAIAEDFDDQALRFLERRDAVAIN